MAIDNYLGAKNGSGVYQAIINVIPPHETYIEGFLGTGAVLKRKASAKRNIGIDLYKPCIDNFDDKAELYHADIFTFLTNFDFDNNGRIVIYFDPPYVISTRTSKNRYENDFTDNDHIRLLNLALSLQCFVIISGYRNDIYKKYIDHWWSHDFQAMTRGGVRTETIWCNFEPKDIHYHTYAGKNFTDRQRIKRKAQGWANKFKKLPSGERQAILAALLSIE